MTLARDPEVSRLRSQIEYLRAVYDDDDQGGEFVFGIDTRTNPDSIKLMEKWPGVKIIPIEWNDDFSEARNTILRNVDAPWAAYFDPDEIPNHALLWWIHEKVREPEKPKSAVGYLFWFRSYFEGTNRRMPETEADYHIRMFRPNAAEFYRPVHELVKIKGLDEGATRGRTGLVERVPKNNFVIHAKPTGRLDDDSRMYHEIETGQRKKK